LNSEQFFVLLKLNFHIIDLLVLENFDFLRVTEYSYGI